jgi:hypothetical protein
LSLGSSEDGTCKQTGYRSGGSRRFKIALTYTVQACADIDPTPLGIALLLIAAGAWYLAQTSC